MTDAPDEDLKEKDMIVVTDDDPASSAVAIGGDDAPEEDAVADLPVASDPRTSDDHLELEPTDQPVRMPTVVIPALGTAIAERTRTRTTYAASTVAIDPRPVPQLDTFAIWEADRILQQGISPQQLREEQADVLMLGKRNGTLLWIEIALCFTLIAGTFLNAYLTLSMPAKGIPSTEQVGIYHKVEKTQEEVEAFAERIAALMESWKYQTITGHARRVTPYLDPTQRAKWEKDFSDLTADAATYKERSLYETVNLKYRGVSNEASHQVLVYYQVYRGRGEHEGMIRFDATVRRLKLMVIQEGAINEENHYGLYVTKCIDIPERAYMESERFANEPNPWDAGLGIRPKKAKAKKPVVEAAPK